MCIYFFSISSGIFLFLLVKVLLFILWIFFKKGKRSRRTKQLRLQTSYFWLKTLYCLTLMIQLSFNSLKWTFVTASIKDDILEGSGLINFGNFLWFTLNILISYFNMSKQAHTTCLIRMMELKMMRFTTHHSWTVDVFILFNRGFEISIGISSIKRYERYWKKWNLTMTIF